MTVTRRTMSSSSSSSSSHHHHHHHHPDDDDDATESAGEHNAGEHDDAGERSSAGDRLAGRVLKAVLAVFVVAASVIALIEGAFWAFWLWFLWSVVRMVLWALACFLMTLYWTQSYLLYMPTFQGRRGAKRRLAFNPRGWQSPADARIRNWENCYIRCSDGVVIHSWLLKQDDDVARQCPTIVYFHGNAGNIAYRLPNARDLLFQTGCNVLMVEYRGYGNSEGHPSESGLIRDGEAALRYLREREDIDSTKLLLFGRSLGGAVAVATAHKHQAQVRALMVENTFTSIDDMAAVLLSRFGFPRLAQRLRLFFRVFVSNHWFSEKRIAEITLPTMFISGLRDELIPPQHMQRLHDACRLSRHKTMLPVANGMHNNTYAKAGRVYYERMSEFITAALEL